MRLKDSMRSSSGREEKKELIVLQALIFYANEYVLQENYY